MAKEREPKREERKDFPEEIPGNQTDLPGRRRSGGTDRPNPDIERMPGDGGATEKI